MKNKSLENYDKLPLFEGVFLEDSFVLDISARQEKIEFQLEIVLTENHPLYNEPIKNEAYCYKNAKLSFKDFHNAQWLEKNENYFTDALGEIDYGNIDFFHLNGKNFELGGDWGHLIIEDGKVNLEF